MPIIKIKIVRISIRQTIKQWTFKFAVFSKIALRLVWKAIGRQCHSSKTISNNWWWKTVSVWKLIVIDLAIKHFVIEISISQVLALWDKKLSFRDRLFDLKWNIREHFSIFLFCQKCQKKYVVIYLWYELCMLK